jgi:hypothetical protein
MAWPISPSCDSRPHHFDALEHALVRHLHQPLRLHRGLAHEEHLAGIAVVAVLDDGDVDVDDVAFLEFFVARDAMAHLVVHRGADGAREALVVERRRDGLLLVDDIIVAQLVELAGGDPGLDVRPYHAQHLGGEPAGDAHFLDFRGGFDGDGHKCLATAVLSGNKAVLQSPFVHEFPPKPMKTLSLSGIMV